MCASPTVRMETVPSYSFTSQPGGKYITLKPLVTNLPSGSLEGKRKRKGFRAKSGLIGCRSISISRAHALLQEQREVRKREFSCVCGAIQCKFYQH